MVGIWLAGFVAFVVSFVVWAWFDWLRFLFVVVAVWVCLSWLPEFARAFALCVLLAVVLFACLVVLAPFAFLVAFVLWVSVLRGICSPLFLFLRETLYRAKRTFDCPLKFLRAFLAALQMDI